MSNYIANNSNIFSQFPVYKQEIAIGAKKKYPDKGVNGSLKKTENNSKKKKVLFGSTLASSILTAGIVGFIFVKGPHGSALKKLSKFSNYLSENIQKTNHLKTKDIPTKTIYYSKKTVKKVIDIMEASANFTAIKDWIANKILRKNKFTGKFADKSTSFFQKIVDKTLSKKYDKVEVKVKDLTSLLKHYSIANLSKLDESQQAQKISIKGITKTLKEWIEILSYHTEQLQTNYDKNFSLGARKQRNIKRSKLLGNISAKIEERFFKDKKSLLKIQNYKTYVTEDAAKNAHSILKEDIYKAKRQITNNIKSIYEYIKTDLNNFSKIVKPNDDSSKKIVQGIRQQLEEFKTSTDSNNKKIADKLLKSIDSLLESLQGNNKYTEEEIEQLTQIITDIKNSLNLSKNNPKGSIDEIISILQGLNASTLRNSTERIISTENLKEYSHLAGKINKDLEKAVELENGEYFLKQAELKVGSAATDILSLIFPIGVGTYSIATKEDKEERISATLTTCVPLVGTFATFVYGTVKMFSGAKNLMFSLVTGAVISKIGHYADKLYKKYKDTGSFVNVVKDEYDSIVTDITPGQNKISEKDKK